ncbi:MAG: hypothetical protein JXB07_20630 [Anaerolineae bacterium]|nr:hypothetical protein [Anaerolineae bacterium]
MTVLKNTSRASRRRKGCLIATLLTVAVASGLASGCYISWCWGLWGRNAELMHYLFDCRCPAASEEARYRPFKVLVSACEQPLLQDISPNGRYVLISRGPDHSRFLLDMETDQSQEVQAGGINSFLNNTLIMTRSQEGTFLLDIQDSTRTPAIYVDDLYKKPPSEQVRQALKDAAQAYKVDGYFVALAPDYKHSPDGNVVILFSNSDYWRRLEAILNELGVSYTEIPSQKAGSVEGAQYSHNGQLWADTEGIHMESTGQIVVPSGQQAPSLYAHSFGAGRWVNNDRAVVYGGGGYRYLFGGGGFSPAFLPYPLPILLLEVPPEYWPEP